MTANDTHHQTHNPGKTLGIIGFIFAFVFLHIPGLVVSIIGYHKSSVAGFRNGLAVAGIVLNAVFMVLSVFILFFITIVAYQGITSRANTNSARANATSVQSYAETFNADNGRYPDSMKDLNDGTASSRLPSGITIVNTDSVLENSKENIRYQYTGSLGAATGGRITYWDFDEKMADDVIYVGDANTDSAEFKDVQ